MLQTQYLDRLQTQYSGYTLVTVLPSSCCRPNIQARHWYHYYLVHATDPIIRLETGNIITLSMLQTQYLG